MYHCRLQFYLTGYRSSLWETARAMPPLERFTHSFAESGAPEAALAAQADVVLADLRELDAPAALETLARNKKQGAELVLLLEKGQMPLPESGLEQVDDIWTLPLSEEEFRFRFVRRQRACKERKDAWQTSQYLEATINSSPSLVWFKDKNGIHEKVNDSFCDTVNKTREQVQGQGHAYIWDVEQDDPACIKSEEEVMERRETCVSEEVVRTGGGTRLLTTYKSPLYDLDGSVMGTVGIGIDITRERAYEQELINKSRTLETIFTSMDCGILCHSLDGSRMISINQAALDILGYKSQEEIMADGFYMVASSVEESDKIRLKAAVLSLKKPGDSANMQYRVIHPDGSVRHVMGNFKLIEKDGETVCQRLLLDITEQKRREDEARAASERRQLELIQALSIDYNMAAYVDLDTGEEKILRIHECSRHILEDIFDGSRTLQQSLYKYVEACVCEEDREMMSQCLYLERMEREMGEKRSIFINYRTRCGGEPHYFQVKAVRAGTREKSRGLVLGFRSIDEEMRLEMEKTELLEDALMQANRASRAKSVFLSNMSHDIRTPMNAIIGFTALAITHIDRREQVEGYLKKIMTSGNHLLSLINDVLDMSRIESGKMYLEEKPCSLPEILHGLRNIVQADVHAKRLELYMDAVDVVNEEIFCDRLRLNQVLLNLLSNSIKYTDAGGTVSIRVTEKPCAQEDSASYEFHIKDTGIGMSEEFVKQIFEPFERERNSTTSGIQGTGLGMSITKNIVDMMNGTIEVRSKQGVGTEFIVSLTFRLCSGAKELEPIPQLRGIRALVVDDDFNACDSVSGMLQQIGLRAEWTLSGKEAVLRTRQAVMRGDHYGVYVIDWLLPDMNGIEVARRIRKEHGGDVPIIVLTAYDWTDIEEEARNAGVTAFCSKPLFLSELRSCLYSIVNADQKKEEAQRPERLPSGRILLAEDNELNQEIAAAILEEAGFTTEIAPNGRVAVEMLKNSQPGHYQLILMDVQMPVMNGYDATREIRALEDRELAGIPILAMTANAFEEDKQAALRCGMNGHIAKPIDIRKLLETLNAMLQ
ncbi:MAG: response regulator [Oscillibacter sp.]|nr:response regulator [Oscillibacter sp.]